MKRYSEMNIPLIRLNSIVKSCIIFIYLTFVIINGFHHHAVSLSVETRFSPYGSSDGNESSYHDRNHCPVCIFSSSQDISESSVIIMQAGTVPALFNETAVQLIYDKIGGLYSPRAPPVLFL